MTSIWDVLIVGGGPAGLAAALALSRRLHTTLIFDSGVYRNRFTSHMHNVPTWDHRNPADFRKASRDELVARYETVQFQGAHLEGIMQRADGVFAAWDNTGTQWLGRKVILATGVRDKFPNIEGFENAWAKGIFHCLFCHGYEERNALSAGVLAFELLETTQTALHVARSARRLAKSVTIYTNGSDALAASIQADLNPGEEFKLNTSPITKLVKQPQGVFAELDDKSTCVPRKLVILFLHNSSHPAVIIFTVKMDIPEEKESLIKGESELEQREAPRRLTWRVMALRLAQLLCLTGALFACVSYGRLTRDKRAIDVDKLMQESPLIGLIRTLYHNDIYQKNFTVNEGLPLHVDFPRLRKGRVGGQFWSVYVDCPDVSDKYDDEVYSKSVHDTFQQIDLVHRLIQEYPETLVGARRAKDVRQNFVQSPGKISSLMGVEGLHQIGNSASILRAYYQLGVRYATLTHFCHNKYADSEHPKKPLHGGLSEAGKALVLEMNRIGMMVDVSHTSADTQRDALKASRAPVIFSHSNAFALCKHTRNAPDDVLHMLKANGGVIMVTFLPGYLNLTGKASLSDVADHIQYIGNLIGYRHVGIGSDYDGMGSAPKGLEDVSRYPALIQELANRGVSAEDLKDLMGRNVLRVMEAVEGAAAELSKTVKPLQDHVET
ncbi:membrane dipeptidase GliJ [Arthroderma uncinatum]|uniref:membrane dipeptidase GliJ n=1 Tax=Arthroderma uncinatum TaxID=74035 RepID=UPI00144AB1F6|nr:membrane dipeptidase GliJ [Arthroderma uncinatum]KAF3479632.1 membrane dipeptidase GliJ [Arthroderma uncinatum]